MDTATYHTHTQQAHIRICICAIFVYVCANRALTAMVVNMGFALLTLHLKCVLPFVYFFFLYIQKCL